VRSHLIGRDRQLGSNLIGGGPAGEELEYPFLLLGQRFDPWRVQCLASLALARAEYALRQTC
jgi:hypothetical protein